MSGSPGWLVDTSAYARLGRSPDAPAWVSRIQQGQVHVTTTTVLEIGHAARTGEDWTTSVGGVPLTLLPVEHATPAIERRAVDLQGMLARRGLHRAPSVTDLLVAATAELAGLVLLHLDRDFDLIAQLTGQPLHRLRVV